MWTVNRGTTYPGVTRRISTLCVHGTSCALDVQNREDVVERQLEPGKDHQSPRTREDLKRTGRLKKSNRTLARIDQHGGLSTMIEVPLTLGSLLFEIVTRRQNLDGQIGDLERMLTRLLAWPVAIESHVSQLRGARHVGSQFGVDVAPPLPRIDVNPVQ